PSSTHLFSSNHTPTSQIYTLSLHDALPIFSADTRRYQIDLLNLQWEARWDVAFLLDVVEHVEADEQVFREVRRSLRPGLRGTPVDRKSTRLNSSHVAISYAVFCLKKKKKKE